MQPISSHKIEPKEEEKKNPFLKMGIQQIMNIVSSVNYTEIIIATICFFFFLLLLLNFFSTKKGQQPWNFPFIGMLHLWFPISTNIFDNLTLVLQRNNGTFHYKGPWFSGRNMTVTCDPTNFHHILTTKFSNYPKGSDTYTLFEPYGEFLFTLDFDEWRKHRKIVHGVFTDKGMQGSNPKVHMEIFKNEMIPVLDRASELGLILNLNDVFRRLFLDITVLSATGYNHGSLNINFPKDLVLQAIVDVNHGVLLRHVLPEKLWKLQRWLGIGHEKKVVEGSRKIDELISKYMLLKKEEEKEKKDAKFDNEEGFSAINFLSISEELKKEYVKGSIFASTDTTGAALSWFFYLIQENPTVKTKIRQEINEIIERYKEKVTFFTNPEELNKLVYLHASILEALRLYPSVPFQSRTCVETDVLPTGHRIKSGEMVLFLIYSEARMKSIWGEDCCEYKPERWISENGGRIIPVSSNKFCPFSSGSRICPGKELGILRLKSTAATIIHNYDIQLLKDYTITPSTEIVLGMKYPLHAKISKRW